MTNINLIGLPGAGKTRLKKALLRLLKERKREELNVLVDDATEKEVINWLVIDIRSTLNHIQAEKHLVDATNIASLIILNFAEESPLDVQIFWQKWITANAPNVPSLRIFHSAFKQDFNLENGLSNLSKNNYKSLKLTTLTYDLKTVNYEHLMAGLEACKHNLGMDIWRVKGSMNTIEYANPVAIEVTVNRWDNFASEESQNLLVISGRQLEKSFIQDVIDAAQLKG